MIGETNHRALYSSNSFFDGVDVINEEWTLFLLQVAIIMSMCQLMTFMADYFVQPRVVFEILGGILLGPSVLGQWKTYNRFVFPDESFDSLSVVSSLGLLVYMFIMGLDMDFKKLKKNALHASVIAILSIIVPFMIGMFISKFVCVTLQDRETCVEPKIFSFYMFISSSMSITAFPVLARMLKDSGVIFTTVGTVVMEAAALNDGIAWFLLIISISITNIANSKVVGYILLCVVAYVFMVLYVLKPLLRWGVHVFERIFTDQNADNNLYSVVFMMVMFSGWLVSQLGLDPIIGSFILGSIIPRHTRLYRSCLHKMNAIFTTLFLPIYFAYSGLRTDFSSIRVHPDLSVLLLIVLLSSLGKFLGAGLPAYCFGFSLREASVIAVLMNTRGLVEFIVLNVGLDAGILSKRTFSVMVIMCVVNTVVAFPIVQLLYPDHLRAAAALKIENEHEFLQGEGSEGASEEDNCPEKSNLGKTESASLPLCIAGQDMNRLPLPLDIP